MTLGQSPTQPDVFRSTTGMFPDGMFADLFTDIRRRSIPPMIVVVVMVLQRLEGLSDREAVDRFVFDVRWKYAADGLDLDHPGFAHTVLVDMRAPGPLGASGTHLRGRPRRRRSGRSGGRQRVLDSTALYDAVTTMDTVILLRSGIRGPAGVRRGPGAGAALAGPPRR